MIQGLSTAAARRISILSVSFLSMLSANSLFAQNSQTGNPNTISPVYVHTNNGAEMRGQLLRLGPDTLSLLDDGAVRDVRLADISRIESRGDSVKNGAIIGAAILGGWCVLICPQGLDGYGRQFAYVLAINTALGAAIGAGIDGMHVGRTTIYQTGDPAVQRRSRGLKAFVSKRFRF